MSQYNSEMEYINRLNMIDTTISGSCNVDNVICKPWKLMVRLLQMIDLCTSRSMTKRLFFSSEMISPLLNGFSPGILVSSSSTERTSKVKDT